MDNTPDALSLETQGSCDALSARDQRALILHILYAADSLDYQLSLPSLVENFSRGFDCFIEPDSELVLRTQLIIDMNNELDARIKPLLDNWKFDRIGCVTKIILRMALWELLNSDLDHSIVINEAIELAKGYAENDAHKFINGILDKWVKENNKS